MMKEPTKNKSTKKASNEITEYLTHYDPRIFLTRVFASGVEKGTLSDLQIDGINEQVAELAHVLVRRKVRDYSSRSEVAKAVSEAFCFSSIGLEYGSIGNINKAASLLTQNAMLKFFKIGNTLFNKLLHTATKVQEQGILKPPRQSSLQHSIQPHEEINIYNTVERQFLTALPEDRMIVEQTLTDHTGAVSANIGLEIPPSYRPIATLADLTKAEEMLNNLKLKASYIRALPKEHIFAAEYIFDEDDDPVRVITQALMINLALYRQVEFRASPEDYESFKNICCDEEKDVNPETRDFLLEWIRRYFESRDSDPEHAEQDEAVKKYAIEYWAYCMDLI